MNYIELIKNYTKDAIQSENLEEIVGKYFSTHFKFYGGHPVNDLDTFKDVGEKFWKPLKNSFSNLKRVEYITLNNYCAMDKKMWVSSTGRYIGNFEKNLYTIPATKRSCHIRFGEFYCIEDGKITECYILLDYLQLMRHAGVHFLPKTLGSTEDIIGPQTNDGLQYGTENTEDSKKSLSIVMSMLAELLVDKKKTSSKQKKYWAEDMTWYGPSGIGTFYTLDGFATYRNAFLNTFPNRDYGNHKGIISKNNYVSVVGWSSVHGTHMGEGWFGLAPTGKKVVMRVMDFWRLKDELIEENWVLIDMIDIFKQLGVDVFENINRFYFNTLFNPPKQGDLPKAIEEKSEESFKTFLKQFI